MELSLTQIIVSAVLGLAGSSGVTAVILRRMDKRKSTIHDTHAEAESLESLLDKIKVLIGEKLEDTLQLQQLTTEIQSLKLVVTTRDSEIQRQSQTIKDILIEQGRAHERELRCQTSLRDMQKRLDEYDSMHRVAKSLVKDNLRMQGTIDESIKGR